MDPLDTAITLLVQKAVQTYRTPLSPVGWLSGFPHPQPQPIQGVSFQLPGGRKQAQLRNSRSEPTAQPSVPNLLAHHERCTAVHAIADYHEDFGAVLMFHTDSFEEPPTVSCGSPLDSNFKEGYWTHFTRFDFNAVLATLDTP
jgi:hypothetical protein